MNESPPDPEDARLESKSAESPPASQSDGEGGNSGGGSGGVGGSVGGSGSGAERVSRRKGMMRIAADGLANGMLMIAVTQGFSHLYFEQPRAMLVGITISLICCIVMLLGMTPIARFIIFHRLILRSTKDNPGRAAFISKWLAEIVMHGLTLFITLLLLALSRLAV